MDGVNKVILIGNLGADPELRMTNGGQAMLKMRLATSRSWKDRDGQRKEKTEWHSLTMWGTRAEALAPHLQKGDRIYVEGELEYREYEKEGQKHRATDIKVSELLFQNGPKQEGGQDRGTRPRQQNEPRQQDRQEARQAAPQGFRPRDTGRSTDPTRRTYREPSDASFDYGANDKQDDNDFDPSWYGDKKSTDREIPR